MFSKILLASDGSEGALKAARVAADLASKYCSEITVVHVFTMPVTPLPFVGAPGLEIDPLVATRYAEEVQEAVERRTGRVLEEAGVPYTTRHETGHAPEVIVSIAQTGGYDLIVVGSRGLSNFSSFLLGSVSDRVSHHAHCPVLIVK